MHNRRRVILLSLLLPALIVARASLARATDIRDRVVYFVYLDRFHDGQAGNNYAGNDPDAARRWPGATVRDQSYDFATKGTPANDDISNWKRYWGGDLQGLTAKLPYLKSLGVGVIYITNPVKQTDAQAAYRDKNGNLSFYTAYHGYWMKDFYRIDEHWAGPTRWRDTPEGADGGKEGWDVFDAFAGRARQLGLEIMVDIPLNHSNPTNLGFGDDLNRDGDYNDPGEDRFWFDYNRDGQKQDNEKLAGGTAGWGESGAVYRDRSWVGSYTDYAKQGALTANNDQQTGWFFDHLHHSSYDAPNDTTFYGFGFEGLAGFNHRLVNDNTGASSWSHAFLDPFASGVRPHHRGAYDYLLGGLKRFVDHGVHNFRIDATKHIELPFLRYITAELADYAKQKHGKSLYFVGEWSGAGFPTNQGGNIKWRLSDGRLVKYATFQDYYYHDPTANFDFDLTDRLSQSFAKGGPFTDLIGYAKGREDWFNKSSRTIHHPDGPAPGNSDWQMNMLNNQDQPRFMQSARYAKRKFGQVDAEGLHNMALAFLLTTRGIPMLFYGDELHLFHDTGKRNGYSDNDPFNRLAMPTGFDNLAAQQPATYGRTASAIRKLADLRRSNPSISRGSWRERWSAADILVFERRAGDDVVLVAMNKGDTEFTADGNSGLLTALPDGSYRDYLNGDLHHATPAAMQVTSGTVNSLALRPREVAVFVKGAGPVLTRPELQRNGGQLQWSPVYGANRYEVESASGADGPWTHLGETTATTFDAGAAAAVRVRAVDADSGAESVSAELQ